MRKEEGMENTGIFGVRIPDSGIAREITQLIRDLESDLLFQHSVRVYYWGALSGRRQGLRFDPELHTTPGIPEHMHPEIALLQAGAGMDIAGRNFEQFAGDEREAVLAAHPRGPGFGRRIIDAFYCGLKHRPASTFGSFNDDFLAFKDPGFQRADMCSIIPGSCRERPGG
jgi:hypothetical protein